MGTYDIMEQKCSTNSLCKVSNCD